MRKILSFLLIIAMLCSLAGCKETTENPAPQQGQGATENPAPQQGQGATQTPDWAKDPSGEGYIDFRTEGGELTPEQAQEILADPQADKASAEYRQAVYTVNEAVVTTEADASQAAGKPTEEAKKYFSGITFYFIEGSDFANAEIHKRILKKGTFAQGEDGLWYLTFHDITLAQSVTSLENNTHAIDEYTEILELLLEDANVVVIALTE